MLYVSKRKIYGARILRAMRRGFVMAVSLSTAALHKVDDERCLTRSRLAAVAVDAVEFDVKRSQTPRRTSSKRLLPGRCLAGGCVCSSQEEQVVASLVVAPVAACIKFDTLPTGRRMNEKPIDWRGSSFKDLLDESIFSLEARKVAGTQLRKVQRGDEPDDWKPFDELGAGTKEIRIKLSDGASRVMYVAKFPEAVYVLHCFKKKAQKTSQHDKDIAKLRYKAVIKERNQ